MDLSVFAAAAMHAEELVRQRDEALQKVDEYRTSADIDHGIKQQLQAELESCLKLRA
jgi:hypothetical protein